MKTQYFKKFIPAVAMLLSLTTTSCVNDLNVEPIDPSKSLEFFQDDVFYKIYATLSLTGNKGPDGMGEVPGIDEGTSGFVRLLFTLNQYPTDESICSWQGDADVPGLTNVEFTTTNGQIKGMYNRLYYNITLVNHFLERTEGQTDEKSVHQRAEARFMRAFYYSYLMDLYGSVPFVEKVSSDAPKQISRADLFNYIISELQAIEGEMYAPKQAPFARADQAANWLLTARIYLNAEVYTGTAQWAKAKEYAEKVITSGYTLAPEYSHLFMADNDGSAVNKADQEIILRVPADGINMRSYSTLFFCSGTTNSDQPERGFTQKWGGSRARKDLVNKFFPNQDAPAAEDLSIAAGDDRALLYSINRTLEVNDPALFTTGYSVTKYSNKRADGAATSHVEWIDMDIPLMRSAEAYLISAEATLRSGGSEADALEKVNALRDRANAKPLTNLTLQDILDERSREFYFEGYRRSDLIRFDSFGGSNNYTWEWKGGLQDGRQFDAKYNLYPIPAADLAVNPNLTPTPGY